MGNASPFDSTAAGYDDEFTRGQIGTLARRRFWREVLPRIPEGAELLELGGGTGEDACFLAEHGVRVLCTDASGAMVATARAKAAARGLESRIECQQLDMSRLHESVHRREALGGRLFNGAYANFGAVNCVVDIAALADGLSTLLRPGAPVFLTLMGPWAPWEWAWYAARGDFSKAFRRLRRDGIEWRGLRVRYPSPRALANAFSAHFSLVQIGVVNAFVPPSYFERAMARRPRFLARLDRLDERFLRSAVVARFADHYLAQFVRK